ncbi:protein OSCP1 isoform X1 [Hydra vulgaris]|uniref:protein OSCP1 isoform X1 n=1 Tax=Hydra vulgaris TaxID=6087 RepID=UPI0006412BAC|nr:protein OSCP1 isoform X1 [Hydra vulgaris]
MSLKTLPILFLNLGGEMVYILDQRLRAQNVSEEKSNKVLYDILNSMLNTKFMEELFKPQDAYSRKAMRTVFDRVAHTSIMRLNSASMDKLYDLMTMAFKYQITLCKYPFEVLMITLNHLDAIRNFAKGSKETLELVDNVYKLLIENYSNMSFGQLQIMRQTLMLFLQDLNIKVSIFLKEKSQLTNGRFILPCGGQLPWGTDVPGTIRLFNESGEPESTKTFDAKFKYNLANKMGSVELLGDRMTNLGRNMYLSQSVETSIEKVMTKKRPVLTESESLSNPNQLAKEELKLLEYLISGKNKQDQPQFRLNLFETDEDELAAEKEYSKEYHKEILFDATNRKQDSAITQLIDDFSIQSLQSAPKGDDLLELMDSA